MRIRALNRRFTFSTEPPRPASTVSIMRSGPET
jgi:hypothetical protein